MKLFCIILISIFTNYYAYTQNSLQLHAKIKGQNALTDSSIDSGHSRVKEIHAIRINKTLNINGIIDEPEWALAPASPHFTQVDPEQGKPALFNTQVKVLYNQQYLYVGFFAMDPLGKKS
ncbi:MAG TPA: hypothetical protein VFE04_00550, partial [Puia sp.]|nr:hypothetical protein [Puia sp.]